ncbi:MAG: serine/threonine-protein kinase HipA [Planctomycetaceae bacterium]|jgi:serine/threonine-protein kinase HipA
MMTSNAPYTQAYVWIWLSGETAPVVAGRLSVDGEQLVFNYGRSYLARNNAITIYDPELPLQLGVLPLVAGMVMPSCIRDASPDAWGRRVLINRKLGRAGKKTDDVQLDELSYLLESGSDRIGALDFQLSSTEYVPRAPVAATLGELLHSVERVEQGVPLTYELDQALHHGSSIGGARPKALIDDDNKKYIAKFSSTTDLYSVIKAEYIAMRLAKLCGLNVAPVQLTQSSGKDVLIIERFDRVFTNSGWERRAIVSSLTMFALDEMMARYASYEKLAEIIRHRFKHSTATLRELFCRLVFNILCGNTDDHARNHAAFWDGTTLELTPAYDICPQGRTGQEASQAMLISGSNRLSRISSCLTAAPQFQITRKVALNIVEDQLHCIIEHWGSVCCESELSEIDQKLLWGRQFINPFAFDDLDHDAAYLKNIADAARS